MSAVSGPLGLKLASTPSHSDTRLQVKSITPGTQATLHPQVQPGLFVSVVQGEDMRKVAASTAMAKIKSAPRPLTIVFEALEESTEPAPTTKSHGRHEIERLYAQHNPEKLGDVDKLVDKYGEAELLRMVSKKYGVESSARQSSAARSAADCVTSDERHEIERLYAQHNPEKLGDVDRLVDKYGEAELLRMVSKKYGVDKSQTRPATERKMMARETVLPLQMLEEQDLPGVTIAPRAVAKVQSLHGQEENELAGDDVERVDNSSPTQGSKQCSEEVEQIDHDPIGELGKSRIDTDRRRLNVHKSDQELLTRGNFTKAVGNPQQSVHLGPISTKIEKDLGAAIRLEAAVDSPDATFTPLKALKANKTIGVIETMATDSARKAKVAIRNAMDSKIVKDSLSKIGDTAGWAQQKLAKSHYVARIIDEVFKNFDTNNRGTLEHTELTCAVYMVYYELNARVLGALHTRLAPPNKVQLDTWLTEWVSRGSSTTLRAAAFPVMSADHFASFCREVILATSSDSLVIKATKGWVYAVFLCPILAIMTKWILRVRLFAILWPLRMVSKLPVAMLAPVIGALLPLRYLLRQIEKLDEIPSSQAEECESQLSPLDI